MFLPQVLLWGCHGAGPWVCGHVRLGDGHHPSSPMSLYGGQQEAYRFLTGHWLETSDPHDVGLSTDRMSSLHGNQLPPEQVNQRVPRMETEAFYYLIWKKCNHFCPAILVTDQLWCIVGKGCRMVRTPGGESQWGHLEGQFPYSVNKHLFSAYCKCQASSTSCTAQFMPLKSSSLAGVGKPYTSIGSCVLGPHCCPLAHFSCAAMSILMKFRYVSRTIFLDSFSLDLLCLNFKNHHHIRNMFLQLSGRALPSMQPLCH